MTFGFVRRLALCGVIAALAGCDIARPGPSATAITDPPGELSGFTLVKVSAENVITYKVSETEDSAGTGGIPGAPHVTLSAGDVVKVHLSESAAGGLFAPTSGGGTTYDNVRIDGDGSITIPYAGKVKAAGLSPAQLAERIRGKVTGVTFDPQVYVELIAGRGSSVLISGDVKKPGRISMLEGPSTLIDVINRADGPAHPAHEEDVVVRRGGKVQRVPLESIMNGNNVALQAGDEITLVPHLKTFNALGTLTKTGQMEFPKPNINLQDAIAIAGGLSDLKSDNKGVFVFRLRESHAWLDSDNKWHAGPVIFQFDYSRPETMFLGQAFGIDPDDTVYVTVAPAVEWVKMLQPIASTLSAIRTVEQNSTGIGKLN